MKALEDALAAPDPAAQLEILRTIPPKDYKKLLEAVEIARKTLAEKFPISPEMPADEFKRTRKTIDPMLDCLSLAILVAHHKRKKFPRTTRIKTAILGADPVIAFLTETRPEWLYDILENTKGSTFNTLRYIREGVVSPPPDSGYYLRIVFHAHRLAHSQGKTLKPFLLTNRDLVERDVPFHIRALSRKQNRESAMGWWYFDREESSSGDRADHVDFFIALGELCKEGEFDFQPFLRACLETILDCQREVEARDLMKIHDQMKPTPHQCLAFQQEYFSFLNSPHKSVVRFALRIIESFHVLPGFDPAPLIPSLAPALQHDSAPFTVEVLELVGKISAVHADVSEEVPEAIATCLLNQDARVQNAALDVLRKLPEAAQSAIAPALAPFADGILPSLRDGFSQWITPSQPEVSEAIPSPEPTGMATGARIADLDSVEDIAFIATGLLDLDPDPVAFERFLNGLARFAAASPKELAGSLVPLEKRASRNIERTMSDQTGFCAIQIFTSRLVLIFGENPPYFPEMVIQPLCAKARDPYYFRSDSFPNPLNFAEERINDLLKSIREGSDLPLLSAPEFELGFISPSVLLERFARWKASAGEIGRFDFIQAICRCQMDGDLPGATGLPEGDDESSRVIRYLLTGEIDGTPETAAWWIAAARTRDPLTDISEHPLLGRFHLGNSPDWTVPAEYRVVCDYQHFTVPAEPETDSQTPLDHLHVLQHQWPSIHMGRYGSDFRWRFSFTPALPDGLIAVGIRHDSSDSMVSATDRSILEGYISELSARRLPLRPAVQAYLFAAINSSSRMMREAGIDLFIQACDDGRLEPAVPEMGDLLARLLLLAGYGDFALGMSRLVPSLRTLASQSPQLRLHIRNILVKALEKPPAKIPGIASLLELFHELLLDHPPATPIDLVVSWKSAGFTGKAKALLAKISRSSK